MEIKRKIKQLREDACALVTKCTTSRTHTHGEAKTGFDPTPTSN